MSYSVHQIIKITKAKPLNSAIHNTQITQLLFDSRKVSLSSGALFFAIKGTRHDGHDYIQDAYAKGVRNFIISHPDPSFPTAYPNANFLQVADSLIALQELARYHRQQFHLKTIAITGSNGKTIIKEWLYELLRPELNIVRSPKSYNSQIGVPLSVWQIDKTHQLGIFEAGISRKGEMAKLADIICPKIGLLTNIGEAHSEGFADKKEKLREKLLLFDACETLIYRKGHPLVEETIAAWQTGQKMFTWSTTGAANLKITQVKKGTNTTTLHAIYTPLDKPDIQQQLSIQVAFVDDAYLENIVHCWAMMLYLGYDNDTIAERMKDLEAVALRLELKAAFNNCTLVNDSYSNDFNSLSIALDFLKQQGGSKSATLILSDILQSKKTPQILYQQVAELLKEKGIQRLIGVGEEIPIIQEYLSDIAMEFYPTTAALQQNISTLEFKNESILLKGARSYAFERIAALLEQKAHRTVLEINLNALTHNLNVFSQYLKPSTKVMAMVKAAAYGTGSFEVARLLEFKQVDYLAVAYTDEGVELRQAGIRLPILVLNPEEAGLETLIRHQLEPEVFSFANLNTLAQVLRYSKKNEGQLATAYPIHINLNTGMNRLGFEAKDIEALGELLHENKWLRVASIFSHLAASEDARHDDFTRQQIAAFEKLAEKLSTYLGYKPISHILNSAGIVRFAEHQMDMVRLGIGLYGIGGQEIQDKLEVVSTLKATISQIKIIQKGETIGYSRAGKADADTRLATISIGYADGYLRQLSKGKGSVVIRGKHAHTVGNVCMDMCMVDVTHIPEAQEGDEVIIFGKEKPIAELATELKTIPYEVLTNISGRVKRIYFEE